MLLEQRIIEDEGYIPHVYSDSLGYDTIGVGFCVDKAVPGAGLRNEEIEFILSNRIQLIKKELLQHSFYNDLDSVRQEAIINMAYNLGVPKLLKFKYMIAAIKKQDWKSVYNEALDSRWAAQVKQRAIRIALCLKNGVWPDN
jgi:lysozyme